MLNREVAVIIPAYNEGDNIKNLVQAINKFYPHLSIIVINDGSSDNTAEQADQAGAIVISHPYNLGYGAALQTGYKYALENGYDIVVQIDGDGQHDVNGIATLLQTLLNENLDLVLGSRFLSGSAYRPTLLRGLGSKFFSLCLRLFSGQDIKDPTTGFQAMTKKVFSLYTQDFFPVDYPDADILMLLCRTEVKLKEVPVIVAPNQRKSMHSNPLFVAYYIYKIIFSMLVIKSQQRSKIL